MKRKFVMIKSCAECPHYDFDRQDAGAEFWGKHWCYKLNRLLRSEKVTPAIPAFCPLPDYKPGLPQP